MTEHEKAMYIINSIVRSSGGSLKPKDYICIKSVAERIDDEQLGNQIKPKSKVPEDYIKVSEIS